MVEDILCLDSPIVFRDLVLAGVFNFPVIFIFEVVLIILLYFNCWVVLYNCQSFHTEGQHITPS